MGRCVEFMTCRADYSGSPSVGEEWSRTFNQDLKIHYPLTRAWETRLHSSFNRLSFESWQNMTATCWECRALEVNSAINNANVNFQTRLGLPDAQLSSFTLVQTTFKSLHLLRAYLLLVGLCQLSPHSTLYIGLLKVQRSTKPWSELFCKEDAVVQYPQDLVGKLPEQSVNHGHPTNSGTNTTSNTRSLREGTQAISFTSLGSSPDSNTMDITTTPDMQQMIDMEEPEPDHKTGNDVFWRYRSLDRTPMVMINV